MKRHIIYIINPIAGTRTKGTLQKLIEEKTKQQNIPFQIFPSAPGGDYSFLHHIIEKQKVTDVIIAGGDGTISQVVKSLMHFNVNFGIIPCGSGNGLALTAEIPKRPCKALQIVFTGKASLIDGFYINDQFACLICGLGFDAQVAHDFANQTKRGLATYIKVILRNFLSARAYSFELELRDVKLETEAYLISIANSNQFGNNFTIAPRGKLMDGLLDIVIITNQNKLSLILQTLRQVAGWNKLEHQAFIRQRKGVIYFQTENLSILNKERAPLHIDGDPAESAEEIKIKIQKKCFRLIQPLKVQV